MAILVGGGLEMLTNWTSMRKSISIDWQSELTKVPSKSAFWARPAFYGACLRRICSALVGLPLRGRSGVHT